MKSRIENIKAHTTASEMAKYIVVLWRGREQVVSFPMQAKHADIFAYVRQECGEVKAVSAGFYLNEPGAFWCGGHSDTLNLQSRPEDRQLIRVFLGREDRRLWDLTIVAAEAQAVAG